MRTIEEVLKEVMKIINSTNEVETSLRELKASGYQIEFNWVKNGGIGTVYYMKRQQVYRIQIAASERCGNYHKAFCIVIPTVSISLQLTDTIKIRNMSASKNPDKDCSGQVNKNNMIKNKIKNTWKN
jgi:hypothetical protein